MSYFNDALTWLHSTFHDNVWMIEIFIVVFLTLLLYGTEVLVYRRLYQRCLNTKNVWDESLVQALHKPLGLLIWVQGICFAADIAGSVASNGYIFNLVSPFRKLSSLILCVWFFVRFIRITEENLLSPGPGKKSHDKTTVHAVAQLLTATVVITGSLIGMQLFNIPISGVLAFGGIGGAAVAFAAKDLLGNFFGGLMVYLDRPFKVGDWIRSPDKNIEGTVEHIGWRLTRIRTFDKRPLYVPNGVFSTIAVENPSRMSNRRIKTFIGLRYDDANSVHAILKAIENMLREHPDIDTEQTLMVNLVEFGASSLNFMIYTFTKTTNWVQFQAIQQDVFLKVIEIIDAHGAQCAFPTQTLHIPDGVSLNTTN